MNAENTLPSRTAEATTELSVQTRVAILFHRFGPYHHARLSAAGRLLSVWGVEACATEDIYRWNKVEGAQAFARVTLTDHDSGDRAWRQEVRRKMRQTLGEIKPQAVVIPGWVSPDAVSALDWCVETKTPVVIMSESNVWDESRTLWKERVKRRLVHMCGAGLVGGTAQSEYLAQLGMPPERIFVGYDIVDNDHFMAKAADCRQRLPECRQALGLSRKYFLASARFVGKKNLVRLLQAYARYRELAQNSEAWDLVLLGDGPLRDTLQRQLATAKLGEHVRLPGFKQYDELPAWYGCAEAFVHASTIEQWGLVVNEAMASGLPVLVSNRCGCAPDLVKDGVNGFTFDPLNVEAMASLMFKLSTANLELTTFGSASQKIIAQWGPDRFGTGLVQAVAKALSQPSVRHNALDVALLRFLLLR